MQFRTEQNITFFALNFSITKSVRCRCKEFALLVQGSVDWLLPKRVSKRDWIQSVWKEVTKLVRSLITVYGFTVLRYYGILRSKRYRILERRKINFLINLKQLQAGHQATKTNTDFQLNFQLIYSRLV